MFGRSLGKPLTRARLSTASLKTLWIRETITREWLDQINEWLLSAGELVWHPLEETIDGEQVKFYPDAEAVLAKLPRLGVPMILHKTRRGVAVLYSRGGMEKAVHKMRDELKLPAIFTLDACRHGGMTELDEAELTDGQGRALSGHKTRQAYAGYAKPTIERALAATRRRHAYRLANAQRTSVQNDPQSVVQNEKSS